MLTQGEEKLEGQDAKTHQYSTPVYWQKAKLFYLLS